MLAMNINELYANLQAPYDVKNTIEKLATEEEACISQHPSHELETIKKLLNMNEVHNFSSTKLFIILFALFTIEFTVQEVFKTPSTYDHH